MTKEKLSPDQPSDESRDDALNALDRIDQWAEAYPLDIFPEPDFKKARELLEAGGMTIDSVSASNMRHVITSVKTILEPVRRALAEQPQAVQGWRTMDSAPLNTALLAGCFDDNGEWWQEVITCYYEGDGTVNPYAEMHCFTHWQPLLPAPEAK
jgi:hypothetical protein